jgi:anaerobic selenocysteine-containing dehydrogenase
MDRRAFIKLTAVTGSAAALAACGNPENQIVRFVPDENIVPGLAEWKPAVCPLCSAGCGLTVRVMGADADVVRNGQAGVVRIAAAKKLEGAPDHPVNRGALCARGQAAIQITYHPDRITQPLKRVGARGDGRYDAIPWDDAIAEVVSRLDALEASGTPRALAFLTRRSPGHRATLIRQFLAQFGAAAPMICELFDDEVLRRANAMSFGYEQLPTFDLSNARYVLSFGADFLGTWNSPVAQNVAYGLMRRGRLGTRGAFVQVESRMSPTGASADAWVPARPGTEGVLALGLAHVMIASHLRPAAGAGRAGELIQGWNEGLTDYTPERVQQTTGVSAARVEQLARQFAETSPAVAIVAGPPLAQSNGLFTALAVNALNALAGNIEQPGGIFFTPQLDIAAALKMARPVARPAPSLDKLAADALAGGPDGPQVLAVDGVNPVFTAPRAWRVGEAFAKVPYLVSFSSFLDETSILADLILPDHSFLESWTESVPESGTTTVAVASVAPPAMHPLYQTRATADVLLDVGRRLKRPLNLPWQTFDEMLAAAFGGLPPATPAGDAWSDAQSTGVWSGTLPTGLRRRTAATAAPPRAGAVAFEAPRFDGESEQYPFHFLPCPSTAFLDGSLAHLPWLQEMPDPLSTAMWCSWVELNPATAARLGVGHGDVVEVASSQGAVHAAAVITPGIAPDVVAMPMGQGHRTFTRYASGRGANPAEVIAPVTEPATGAIAWAATRVRVSRIGPADGRLILFGGGLREQVEGHR